jgi:hypothetical protein
LRGHLERFLSPLVIAPPPPLTNKRRRRNKKKATRNFDVVCVPKYLDLSLCTTVPTRPCCCPTKMCNVSQDLHINRSSPVGVVFRSEYFGGRVPDLKNKNFFF